MLPLKKLLLGLALLTQPLHAAPNIILVMTDDLGFGDLYNLHQSTRDNGAGGGTAGDGLINGSEEAFIFTPNIDRMAAEGAKLTRHYTSAPVCAPARGSLLQGRDQGHANIRNNSFDKVISDNHTLGTVMQTAGYYTACVGKWGVGGTSPTVDGRPNSRGFDYFYGYIRHGHGHQHYPGNGGTVIEQTSAVTTGLDHAYTTDLWTAKTKQIIQDRVGSDPETPFFIYLAYDAPHAQLQVPTQAYPAGSGITGGLSWPLNTNSGTNDSYIHPDYASLGNAAARHATMVRRIDHAMGDILQTLRGLNIADNTLVIFTSDNGTHNESGSGGSVKHDPQNFDSYGNFEGIKRDTWEGGIRMPTFAWWPTQIGDNNPKTEGLNSTRPSAFWDWMPTLSEAAGLTPPAWSSGVSLLPELTGSGTQLDKGYLYFEYQNNGSTPNYADFPVHKNSQRAEMQVVFLDDSDGTRYKGIRYNITSHSQDFLIYDVDADPGETTNLAASKVDLQQNMKDKVLQVRTDGDYTRSYLSSEFAAPNPPTSAVNGLNYRAYTGQWDWVPETAYLTPVASGDCTHLDLTQRPQDQDLLLEFTGYISIPSEGTYTFQMTTDSSVSSNASGGMLWIHDSHVIDDDFHHDGSPQTGSMRLQAGLHPVRVLYKHSSGNHDINLQYSGPGISQQTVPNSAFYRFGTPPPEPIANPDRASTTGTTPVSIPVLANDSDDGAPSALSIQSVTQPHFGSVQIIGNQVEYTATAGKFGSDQFSYQLTDGQFTATASVTVDVNVATTDLWFPLNETSGASVYEAGGLLAGSMAAFTAPEAAHVAGKHGFALSFNGTSDAVSLTDISVPTGSSARTVGAWIKSPPGAAAENQVIFGYGENNTGERFSFRLDNGTNQVLRLEVQNGFIKGSTTLNDGSWHHVAVVVDDFDQNGSTDVNEARLYVDGMLENVSNSSSASINTAAGSAIMIGASPHASGYNFGGEIDELKIFHASLTSSEIVTLVNANEQAAGAWWYRHHGNHLPAWTSDGDLDGVSALSEYAFGGNPHIADPSLPTPEVSFNSSSGKLEVTYNRRVSGSHALTYTVQVSNDLSSWTLPSTEISAENHPLLGSDFQRVMIEADDSTTPTDKRFLRILAE
ncbi:sulfatase-like hydrolase/transferase [Verrucomicrobiaceae bacterium R5-34]|nr:sulfatase-like hydrolase/transferase [Verrucomicrobiaceae bacterium R5-34]